MYIDDLIGVRYKSGGNGPFCYDCYNYVREICHRGGKELPFVESEGMEGTDLSLKELDFVRKNLEKVDEPKNELDLILFKNSKGIMDHIGVYLGNHQFAHCNKYGGHIDKLDRYKNCIGQVYSWHK